MIQNIVQYLNLRLETLGRIADLHGISERRKRESDGANVPYCYVGSGEFKAVNIDNGNVGWWRPRGGFTMEPVEVIGRAVRQQRATYPLRFVAILRRELSTSDDAFMPSRLAEDIANALNFDNGDLRGILKAINVEARASGGEFDAATIWPTEFQTSIPDLRYELAMVAVDVTVEVVGRYSCWEGECATDTDILHLFNFCDPSVVARLTPAQVECLQVIAEDANWELFNTEGTLLETGSIPSGDTDSIVAPDATVLINGTQVDTVASGDAIDLPVVNGGSNPVGSEQSGEWVIGNSTVTINGTQVGDIEAEDSLPIAVELDGNPSGVWNAGTQTWEVTSPPCADGLLGINGNAGLVSVPSGGTANVEVQQGGVNVGSWNGTRWIVPPCAPATFSIDGTQVDTIASGADLNVSVELNGSPVMPTYNSGTKVIGVTGGVSAALSVSVSDATPDFGDTITITATATGFVPTQYQFLLFNGSVTLLAQQVGNTLNWTVNVIGGNYDIYVLATDGASNTYGVDAVSIQVDPDAAAFFLATGITNVVINAAVENLVIGLKSFGIWSKIKAMYPLVGGVSNTHKFNLKDPRDLNAAYRLAFFGGVTHNSDGITGNGTNAYAQTYFVPNGNLNLNTSGITWYSRTSFALTGGDNFPMGAYGAAGQGLGVDYSGASSYVLNNDGTFDNAAHLRNGVISVNRTVSTTKDLWRNGTKISAIARNTTSLPTNSIGILAVGTPQYYTNANIATAVIHDGMTDVDMGNLHSLIQTFNTSLGR
jgi:hypothetical protein